MYNSSFFPKFLNMLYAIWSASVLPQVPNQPDSMGHSPEKRPLLLRILMLLDQTH